MTMTKNRRAIVVADTDEFDSKVLRGYEGHRFLFFETKERTFETVCLVPGYPAVNRYGVSTNPVSKEHGICGISVSADIYKPDAPVHVLMAGGNSEVFRNLTLNLYSGSQNLAVKKVSIKSGIGSDTLGNLPQGNYEVYLSDAEKKVSNTACFSVSEYELSPLSAFLTSHEFDDSTKKLSFFLSVKIFGEIPEDGTKFVVRLTDADNEKGFSTLASENGILEGAFITDRESGLKIQTQLKGNIAFITETFLPGMKKSEASEKISNLGKVFTMSLVHSPKSIYVSSGGWFVNDSGKHSSLPLELKSVFVPELNVRENISGLCVVYTDIITGTGNSSEFGDVKKDKTLRLTPPSSACVVSAGGFVGNKPFEGYAVCFRKKDKAMTAEIPEKIAMGEEVSLVVRTKDGNRQQKSFFALTVRDSKVTCSSSLDTALSGEMKRRIEISKPKKDISDIEVLLQTRGGVPKSYLSGGGVSEEMNVGSNMPVPIISDAEGHPEVVCCGVYEMAKGECTLPLNIRKPGVYTAEYFATDSEGWESDRIQFSVRESVQIETDLPDFMEPGESAEAKMHTKFDTAKAGITVTAIKKSDRGELTCRTLFSGSYSNADAASGIPLSCESDTLYQIEVTDGKNIGTYRKFVGTSRGMTVFEKKLRICMPGDILTVGTNGIVNIIPQESLKKPVIQAADSLTDYGYCCCEQTAAKMASSMYTDLLNSDSRVVQTVLVGLILTGFLQTAGFLKKMLTLKLRKKRLAS